MQLVMNGLVVGCIYGLIALGYTMVYGIMGLINFAHGEVVMIGAMITISILNAFIAAGIDLNGIVLVLLALMCATPICMALGYSIELCAYRPLRNAPRLAPLITAIGMSIVLQQVAAIIWGTRIIPFPTIIDHSPIYFLGSITNKVQIMVITICFILMAALLLMINKTRLGRAMRATSEKPDIARLMGVNINRIISITFMLGSGLGAVAGVMMAANYGQISYTSGFLIGLKAFCAAVLGGIGNISGAVLGGILMGISESLFTGLVGSQWQDVFSFAVLIIVLIFRPNGLLGEKQSDRA